MSRSLAPDYRLEVGLLFVDLLAIHLDLAKHLSQLELRFADVLLISAPDSVAGFGDSFDSIEFGAILHQHRRRLAQIEKIETSLANFFGDASLRRFILRACEFRIPLRLLRAKAKFAGTGNFLRSAEAGVIKIAGLVAGKGLRTADREMLQRKLRIGKRRDLARNLFLRAPMTSCRRY